MTREPYYADDMLTLWHGDALDVVTDLPDASVDCVVTSPPYYGLRDYGHDGQYGLEDTPGQYIATMRALFAQTRRVLADDGTFWLNIGDSYSVGGGTRSLGRNDAGRDFGSGTTGQTPGSNPGNQGQVRVSGQPPAKNLLGIPWRVALELQDDGWILRNAIIWHKPNAMPESVTDRLSTRYETVFLFAKKPRYWFDLEPIREPLLFPDAADGSRVFGGVNKAAELQTGSAARRTGHNTYGTPRSADEAWNASTGLAPHSGYRGTHQDGKNPGDVWSIATQPFRDAHFAVMPRELARRAIIAGCKPGGTVLDPFSGSGTTGLAAADTGRRYVGIDLSADYLRLSLETRLRHRPFDLEGLA